MASITFASSISAVVRGPEHVLLLAPRSALQKRLLRVLPARWARLVARMTAGVDPGGLGKCVTTTLESGATRRLSVGVLPDAVSRHLAPARTHAILECCAKAELRRGKNVGILLCLDDAAHWLGASNAIGQALPLYTRKTSKKNGVDPKVVVAAVGRDGAPLRVPGVVAPTVAAARWAAALVDRPTAELSTAGFVEEALRETKGLPGVKSKVIVGDALKAAGLGGIHAVGRAAMVAPRLLVLEHAPAKPRRTVALVGKGIVFDTGGLSLKPREGMVGMKCDMGGGAAVVGAFITLVKGKCPDRVVCLVPLAENAIGPDAYRVDEILTLHSGKTVEINNTDAEGRLLLADAASYAARTWRPDVLVDAATLTGAQVIATGRKHAAVVSNRAGLEAAAVRAGLVTGDACHPLPFAPELYQREFKSEVADMTNSVSDRMNAQTSCAAQFVWSHFEDTRVPWLHVDLAGPAFPKDRATGFGVALISELVRSLQDADLTA